MALNIAFLTTLGYNVGDEFIREGILALLDRLLPGCQVRYIDKLDEKSLFEHRADEVGVVADKYWSSDLVIVSGAPVYWHLHDGQSTSLTSAWHDWFWRQRVLHHADSHPRLMILGAGSCQPWGDSGTAFVQDPGCAEFARRSSARASVLAVRDQVAAQILRALGIESTVLPCPAFLASSRLPNPPPPDGSIAVNLMPKGGHYQLGAPLDLARWEHNCRTLVSRLRKIAPIYFVAHDSEEKRFMEMLRDPGEALFFSSVWRPYLRAYGRCSLAVCNRVHGAVCAASFGAAAIVLGSDTRAGTMESLGLPVLDVGKVDPVETSAIVAELYGRQSSERTRLVALREQTIADYCDLLAPHLPARRTQSSPAPLLHRGVARLADVHELASAEFRGWMVTLNTFAARHGLRTFTNWSKIWEYPWLWMNGLGSVPWHNQRLLDLGSELSPMPWFLATLGARVLLVETNPQWTSVWKQVRADLQVDVEWHIVTTENLPVADASVDVVTSLSVIEHQPNKPGAVNEIVRALRPGGLLAMSFDICETELGMTFPAWNGTAMTRAEFEQLVWRHPAFGQLSLPEWNVASAAPFLEWHRTTAPHHNYIVGAACLRKSGAKSAG